MKKGIHPEYHRVTVTCVSCGATFETGSTLKANNLEVKDYVTDISARLIANIASLKLRKNEIEELVSKMEAVTINDNNSNS